MRNFKITVNGQAFDVTVEEVGGATAPVAAPVAPVAAAAPVAAPKAAPVAPAAPVAAGGVKITAPMPGMIVGMKVENGATVKKGQAIMVLEAMKMENDVAAAADGVITFAVTKGATVNSGDLLAVIK